jgi:hypothetical protein
MLFIDLLDLESFLNEFDADVFVGGFLESLPGFMISIKSMIDDDDDKMSVRSGSTMRSNKSNNKDNKDTININDINLTTQTISNVKKEENSFAKLSAKISLKSTLSVKAVQKDARILELEDLCQLLMDQLRDNEKLVNNMKND